MDTARINKLLLTKEIGRNIIFLEETNSTNVFAKELPLDKTINGLLIIAEHQTSGIGRRGRIWTDEAGANILFSIVMTNFTNPNLIPFASGIAVAKSISEISVLKTECKWPNDVLLNNKKISGTLIEKDKSKLIIGVGININQTNFGDLNKLATSLFIETNKIWDRELIIATILNYIEPLIFIAQNNPNQIIDLWKKYTNFFGKIVEINTETGNFTAEAIDVNELGLLIIKKGNTIETLSSADVSIKIN
ncbi:MAG: biotin--[acetyl-CoA-carboxylase] ligase [Bacteroidetes bacterium]|nr:biotin--[acetyl-CoA-carboxylase] ligase [Bacteroidota bacterium]